MKKLFLIIPILIVSCLADKQAYVRYQRIDYTFREPLDKKSEFYFWDYDLDIPYKPIAVINSCGAEGSEVRKTGQGYKRTTSVVSGTDWSGMLKTLEKYSKKFGANMVIKLDRGTWYVGKSATSTAVHSPDRNVSVGYTNVTDTSDPCLIGLAIYVDIEKLKASTLFDKIKATTKFSKKGRHLNKYPFIPASTYKDRKKKSKKE